MKQYEINQHETNISKAQRTRTLNGGTIVTEISHINTNDVIVIKVDYC